MVKIDEFIKRNLNIMECINTNKAVLNNFKAPFDSLAQSMVFKKSLLSFLLRTKIRKKSKKKSVIENKFKKLVLKRQEPPPFTSNQYLINI